jgi:hypothetical protein
MSGLAARSKVMPATSAAEVEAFGFIATGNLGDESMWEPDSEGIFRMANRPAGCLLFACQNFC